MSHVHKFVFTCKHSAHIKEGIKPKPNLRTREVAGYHALNFENSKLINQANMCVHICVCFQVRLIISTVLQYSSSVQRVRIQ